MTDPDGKVEAPWEVSIRRTRKGFVVSYYIELNDSESPLYRLEEFCCESLEEAYGEAAQHLGVYDSVATRMPNDDE